MENRPDKYPRRPERLDEDTITYIWERLAFLGVDFELDAMRHRLEVAGDGIATLESLMAFADELKDKIKKAPIQEAEQFAKLELFQDVMRTLEEISQGR